MVDVQEQIASLEEEIRKTPYHKGTERHIGILRARIAKLKDKQIEGSKGSGGGGGYAVKKQGDATVVLVGPPSVGKSTLINKLTNAQSKVAPYAFTTLTVIPGMMEYKNAQIQILDVPGIIKGAEEGKGRGREVLSVVRGCELIVIITDPKNSDAFNTIESSLERNGIRINQNPPDISIDKRPQGGLFIQSNIKQDISENTIEDIAHEFGIRNADIVLREKVSMDQLLDAFSANRVYIKGIRVLNKIDEITGRVENLIDKGSTILISADKDFGLDELKEAIWNNLGFIRVYLIKPDSDPNFDEPIIIKKGKTLKDVTREIGSDFSESKTRAKIWGTGAKFAGQEVSLTTKVQEGMQIRFLN